MPKFSALIYARQDNENFLDRCLASLTIVNDVLLINADKSDEIRNIARPHRVRVLNGVPGVTPGAYLMDAFHPWILVIRPFETLSDELIRSLQQWKRRKRDAASGYAFAVLEQQERAWAARSPEFRLVNRRLINWTGDLPPNSPAAILPGPILRYKSSAEAERIAS